MNNPKKEVHNSEYNRRLIKLSEQYLGLVKIKLQTQIKEMKEGARNIAMKSKNPELMKICDKLDKLEIK